MKRVGQTVELIEDAIVYDGIGPEVLFKGTQGRIKQTNGMVLTLITSKGTYDGIPIDSVDAVAEGKVAS